MIARESGDWIFAAKRIISSYHHIIMEAPTHGDAAAATAAAAPKINIRTVSDALEKAAQDVKSPLKEAVKKTKARYAGNNIKTPSSSSSTYQDKEMTAAAPQNAAAATLPVVPPDEALQSMAVFVDETLANISIPTFFDVVWSDTTSGEFYGPWLAQNGKMKILVSDWEEAGEGGGYIGPIDHEQYDKKRVITFITKRQGIGPATAEVTQTHMCRIEGADKCVVAITINMKVPFGDSFSVSVRWVASRAGAKDLLIQCGMAVIFHKSCLVENKIRTNTTAETKKGQGSLFVSMRKRLQPEPTLTAGTPYSKEPSEEITQSDDSCWAGICAIFGTEATKQEAVASPTSVSYQDIVLSICDAHHKLGQVHDNVFSGCCDPSLVRKELKKIHTSLSKMTDN